MRVQPFLQKGLGALLNRKKLAGNQRAFFVLTQKKNYDNILTLPLTTSVHKGNIMRTCKVLLLMAVIAAAVTVAGCPFVPSSEDVDTQYLSADSCKPTIGNGVAYIPVAIKGDEPPAYQANYVSALDKFQKENGIRILSWGVDPWLKGYDVKSSRYVHGLTVSFTKENKSP